MENIIATIKKIECQNYDKLDYQARETLQQLYLQLNLQPVKFTALGFYTINLELLASILIGIFTYQVILVQFKT